MDFPSGTLSLSSWLLYLLIIWVYNSAWCARTIFTFLQLILVVGHILFLKFSHLLNFIEINNKAFFFCVLFFNTFSTEYCLVIRAIEMYDSFLVLTAQFFFKIVIKRLLIKVRLTQYLISLDNLIEDIDIQWKSFNWFYLFNQLSA